MGNLHTTQKPGNNGDEVWDDDDSPLVSPPLDSLLHDEAPEIKFSKNRTPLTVLLEMQPDLLRYVFSNIRSEEVFKMRIVNHYMYWLISNQVNLYFMNQVMLPSILEYLTCRRVISLKVASQGDVRDAKRTKEWLQKNTHLEELELVYFSLEENPQLLNELLAPLQNLKYLALSDKKCSYNTSLLTIEDTPVRHLCLKNRELNSHAESHVSRIDLSAMHNITELTLHNLRLDQTAFDLLSAWVSNPHTILEGFHLLCPIFEGSVNLNPLLDEALANKHSLKRFSVSWNRYNYIQLNPSDPLYQQNFLSTNSKIESLFVEYIREYHDFSTSTLLSNLDQMRTLRTITLRGLSADSPCCVLPSDSTLDRVEIDRCPSLHADFFANIVCQNTNVTQVKVRQSNSPTAEETKFENRALKSLTLYEMSNAVTFHMRAISNADFTPAIQYLDLTFTRVHPQALGAAVLKCQHLVQLSMVMSLESETYHDPSHMSTLFGTIRRHPKLRSLNMSRNTLDNATFLNLHKILENKNLEVLKMNVVRPLRRGEINIELFRSLIQVWRQKIVEHSSLHYVCCHGFGCGSFHNTQYQEAMRETFAQVPTKCIISVE